MFSFLKTKATLFELAESVFNHTINANAEYDAAVLERAKSSGYDVDGFAFEYLCLRMFSTLAGVRHALSSPLWEAFLDQWFARVRLYTESLGLQQIIQTTRGGEIKAMDQWITGRILIYMEIVSNNPHDHTLKIAAKFSELCSGDPKNTWLNHIGESTFIVRANAIALGLKSVRAVP